MINSCELVTLVSSLSCCIAKGKSVDEITFLSAVFMALGDNLALIAENESKCNNSMDSCRNENNECDKEECDKEECDKEECC